MAGAHMRPMMIVGPTAFASGQQRLPSVRCSRTALFLLFALLTAVTREFAPVISRDVVRPSHRRAMHVSCAADTGEDNPSTSGGADAASAFMKKPRVGSGKDAFDDTTWSVLMRLNEGGSTIFTMQLLEDDSCRFSDSDQFGTWECEKEWLVVEKPKGFFDSTLFFTAKLAPPSKEKPKWRLVDGIVQAVNVSSNAATEAVPQASAAESDDEEEVEVKDIGTFGANEFEESLLNTMNRFQRDDADGTV